LKESIAKKSKKVTEDDPSERNVASVEDLTFGPILNKGCSAAVYAAKWNDITADEDNGDWPLAVKMLFNYDIESNAFAILRGMVKEIVPARSIDLKNLCDMEQRYTSEYSNESINTLYISAIYFSILLQLVRECQTVPSS